MTADDKSKGQGHAAPGAAGAPFPMPDEDYELAIRSVRLREAEGGYEAVIGTSRGELPSRFLVAEGQPGAAVFLSGALGGTLGPARGLWPELGEALVALGVSAFIIGYRCPGEFAECVLDALTAVSFLRAVGARRIALVGHSFGGAVAIKAGVLQPAVAAVAALSSQMYGTSEVAELAPRPLLLVHGTEDAVIEHVASEMVYALAREPKRLVLLPAAGHSLESSREELRDLLRGWLVEQLVTPRA